MKQREEYEEYKGCAVYEECLAQMTGATAFFEVLMSELLYPHYGQIRLLV